MLHELCTIALFYISVLIPSALSYYPFAHVASITLKKPQHKQNIKKTCKSVFSSSQHLVLLPVTSSITVSNVSFQRYSMHLQKCIQTYIFLLTNDDTQCFAHGFLTQLLSIVWKSLISVHRDLHFFLQLDSIPLSQAVIYLNRTQLMDICFQSVLAQII